MIIIFVVLFLLLRPKKEKHQRVVITLVTRPENLRYIKSNLESLINQKRKADKIYLNLPLQIKYTIPKWLKGQPEITITRCENWGKFTKIIPAIEREIDPDTIILVVNDKVWYSPDLVDNYLDYSSKNQGTAICLASEKDSSNVNPCISESYAVKRGSFSEDYHKWFYGQFVHGWAYEIDDNVRNNPDCYLAKDEILCGYLFQNGIKKKFIRSSQFTWLSTYSFSEHFNLKVFGTNSYSS